MKRKSLKNIIKKLEKYQSESLNVEDCTGDNLQNLGNSDSDADLVSPYKADNIESSEEEYLNEEKHQKRLERLLELTKAQVIWNLYDATKSVTKSYELYSHTGAVISFEEFKSIIERYGSLDEIHQEFVNLQKEIENDISKKVLINRELEEQLEKEIRAGLPANEIVKYNKYMNKIKKGRR